MGDGCGGLNHAHEAQTRGRPLKVVRAPAVAQQHRDGEQPWVLAGPVSDTADEPVEVLADMEFFEEGAE